MSRHKPTSTDLLFTVIGMIVLAGFLTRPQLNTIIVIGAVCLALLLIIGILTYAISRHNVGDMPAPYKKNSSTSANTLHENIRKHIAVAGAKTAAGVGSTPLVKLVWSRDLLHALEWKRFEALCRYLYEVLGHCATLTRTGADGGVDIYLSHPESPKQFTTAVQCKSWKTYKVGVKPVRELLGVMAAANIATGIFITSGEFTDEAKIFAHKTTIELVDGVSLLAMIRSLPEDTRQSLLKHVTAGDYTTPTCPACDIKMVHRTKKHDSTSNGFWGCRHYPRCRQTLKS